MVTRTAGKLHFVRGVLSIEMVAAIALLLMALLPLAYSLGAEKRLARSLFHRSVAMELVDGEMEVLRAGEWERFGPGEHPYTVQAASAASLPPGRFVLTIHARQLRLEWIPVVREHGGRVLREVCVP